jgi:hypothetical protein
MPQRMTAEPVLEAVLTRLTVFAGALSIDTGVLNDRWM